MPVSVALFGRLPAGAGETLAARTEDPAAFHAVPDLSDAAAVRDALGGADVVGDLPEEMPPAPPSTPGTTVPRGETCPLSEHPFHALENVVREPIGEPVDPRANDGNAPRLIRVSPGGRKRDTEGGVSGRPKGLTTSRFK